MEGRWTIWLKLSIELSHLFVSLYRLILLNETQNIKSNVKWEYYKEEPLEHDQLENISLESKSKLKQLLSELTHLPQLKNQKTHLPGGFNIYSIPNHHIFIWFFGKNGPLEIDLFWPPEGEHVFRYINARFWH